MVEYFLDYILVTIFKTFDINVFNDLWLIRIFSLNIHLDFFHRIEPTICFKCQYFLKVWLDNNRSFVQTFFLSFVRQNGHLFVCLFFFCFFLFVCLSVCLSVWLSVWNCNLSLEKRIYLLFVLIFFGNLRTWESEQEQTQQIECFFAATKKNQKLSPFFF